MLGKCPIDHFLCANQRCVPDTVVCNGENDCGDHTDESEGCLGKSLIPKKQRNILLILQSYNDSLACLEM